MNKNLPVYSLVRSTCGSQIQKQGDCHFHLECLLPIQATRQVRHPHVVKRLLKRTNGLRSYHQVFHMTCILCLIQTSKCIFGGIYPILCWYVVKLTPNHNKTNLQFFSSQIWEVYDTQKGEKWRTLVHVQIRLNLKALLNSCLWYNFENKCICSIFDDRVFFA